MPKGIRKTPILSICPTCSKSHEVWSTGFSKDGFCSKECAYIAVRDNRDIDARLKKLLSGARYRAKNKNLNFNLTLSYLKDLWSEQNGSCVITGVTFDNTFREDGIANKNAPSLDRIVPDLGYTQGNVRFITYQCNMAKGVYTDKDFYKMCELALTNRGVAR